MLVFDHTGVRNFALRIIDNRITLIVLTVEHLCLKPHGTVLKSAQLVSEILIDLPCKDDLLRYVRILFPEFKEVYTRAHLCPCQHLLHDRRVPPDRNPLISVIKVVIIINEPARKSLNDKCRKLRALSAPLFLRVALDQFLINIPAHKEQRLLFQILGFSDTRFFLLLFYDVFRLLRRPDSPHLAESIHIKRKIVEFILIDGHR